MRVTLPPRVVAEELQPDRGFRTITVTEQIYEQVKQRTKKEDKSVATFASQALEIVLFVEDRF